MAALAVNAGVDNGSGTRFEGYHIAQVLTGGEIVIAPDFLSGAVPVAVCVNKQKLLATLRQVVRYGNKNAGHRSGYDGLEMLVPGVSGTLCQEHALAEVKAFSKQVMSQLGAPRLVTMEMVKGPWRPAAGCEHGKPRPAPRCDCTARCAWFDSITPQRTVEGEDGTLSISTQIGHGTLECGHRGRRVGGIPRRDSAHGRACGPSARTARLSYRWPWGLRSWARRWKNADHCVSRRLKTPQLPEAVCQLRAIRSVFYDKMRMVTSLAEKAGVSEGSGGSNVNPGRRAPC